MRRLGIELTDRCNLACKHCLRDINHDRKNVSTELLLGTLREAAGRGFSDIVFTGGEPTLHPDFPLLLKHTVSLGLSVTVITNGQRPEPLWNVLQHADVKENVIIALSIEAADQESFEAVRGIRSYRRFMNTVLGLKARRARTRFSVTIGPWNRHQWKPLIELASQLGIDAVSVAVYQETAHELKPAASLQELRSLHAEIEQLAATSQVPIILSFEPITDNATHLCSTLGLEDLNLNHRGQFTFCCQLSSLYKSPHPENVVIGELESDGVGGGIAAQQKRVAQFLAQKQLAWKNGPPQALDVNPCFYCLRTFDQLVPPLPNTAA